MMGMRASSTLLFLLSWALATSVDLTVGNAQSYSPQIGHRHPDLTLPQIGDRKAVSLASFRGKKVLLIHFASW
jgi:hypothetical protein